MDVSSSPPVLRDDYPILLGSGCAATVHTALSAAPGHRALPVDKGLRPREVFLVGACESSEAACSDNCTNRLSEVKSKLLRRFLKVMWNLVAANMFPSASNSFTRKTGLFWGPFGSREPQTALSTHFGGYQQGPREAEFSEEKQNPEALPRDSLWNQLKFQIPVFTQLCLRKIVPLSLSLKSITFNNSVKSTFFKQFELHCVAFVICMCTNIFIAQKWRKVSRSNVL